MHPDALIPMLAPAVARLTCDACHRVVVVREDDTLLGAERGKFYCCGWCEDNDVRGAE